MQTSLQGFQRRAGGLLAPARSLNGFVRQGMGQAKKPSLVPTFGRGSVSARWGGSNGKFNVTVTAAVSGAVANAFMYLPKAILPGTGSWYWEIKINGGAAWPHIGMGDNIVNPGTYMGYGLVNYGWYNSGPVAWAANPALPPDLLTLGIPVLVAGDTLAVLYNSNNRTIDYWPNNVQHGIATSNVAENPMYPMVAIQIGDVASFDVLFGPGNTKYALPAGFKHYGS